MSELSRFKIKDQFFKARIYVRGSYKLTCASCGEREFGLLIRHISPIKKDMLICHPCLVKITLGDLAVKTPKEIQNLTRVIVKRKKRKPNVKKQAIKAKTETEADILAPLEEIVEPEVEGNG